MTTSYNGWPASPNRDTIHIVSVKIGTDTIIQMAAAVAPLFNFYGETYDRNIDNINGGVHNDWGWNFRPTTGGGSISCHASGTAADFDATSWPRGTNHMPYMMKEQIRALIRKINAAGGKTMLKWGGEWFGEYKDQMHTEMASNTSPADVHRTMDVLRKLPSIDASVVRNCFTTDGKDRNAPGVGLVQHRLHFLGYLDKYTEDHAGAATRAAYKKWQRATGYDATGSPNNKQLQHLSHLGFNVYL